MPPVLRPIEQGAELREKIVAAQRRGQRVGLVPTMGALHEGHLSLIDAARDHCDRVAATIFVNPTQFGPDEDYEAYPRDHDRDLALLADRGADWAFVPPAEDVFRSGHDTFVDVGQSGAVWEGASRPTHFRGVATIVLKLFHLAPADVAYFGQKDYQQTVVIRQMTEDLDVPVKIHVCPIVRQADGLALSSRNAYLSPEERLQALTLYQSLEAARAAYQGGLRSAEEIRRAALNVLGQAEGVEVDYVAVFADGTVHTTERVDQHDVVAVAARVGSTRLIDNIRLGK